MSFGDINSGATPQPGAVVYRKAEDNEDNQKTVQEEVAQATQDALNFEGAFANVKAAVDSGGAVTVPVVEADDAKASGGSSAGQGDPDLGGDGTDSPVEGGNARVPDNGDEDSAPAKSALKEEWVKYAVSQGASEDEANDSTKEELIEKYGD